jgi:uncharacterized protein YycO
MKKIICSLILSSLLISCSSLKSVQPWQAAKKLETQWYKVQIGDVIIKNKGISPLEWYGHVGVVVDQDNVGDFPLPFLGYFETPYQDWLDEDKRKVVLLRYKNFTKEFEKQFFKNIEKMRKSKYIVTLNKESLDYTYCSKYIWGLFNETSKDLGYGELDLDRDGGLMVFPYDFLEVKNLEYVK